VGKNMTVGNLNSIGFDQLNAAYGSSQVSTGASALKGAMNTQKMIQNSLSQMLREVTPHLGQHINVEA
jgi:hypothetical protein